MSGVLLWPKIADSLRSLYSIAGRLEPIGIVSSAVTWENSQKNRLRISTR
jgi:hypothetical protein